MPADTTAPPGLILASASPRRRELLRQIGVAHQVASADIDERRQPGETIEACVRRLACEKAERIWSRLPAGDASVVLAADTAVVIDGQLLGKPADREQGLAMLGQLSGRTHHVLTAIAVRTASGTMSELSDSEVRFRELQPGEADRYWASGEPCDKAGGYAIQGFAAAFIAHLHGSYSGVMGLPLHETAALLQRAGVPLWQEQAT